MRTIYILLPLVLALVLLASSCTVPAAGGTTEPAEPTTFAEEVSTATQPTMEASYETEPESSTAATAAEEEHTYAEIPLTTGPFKTEPVAVSAYSGDLPEEVRDLPVIVRAYDDGIAHTNADFWQGLEDYTAPEEYIVTISNVAGLSVRIQLQPPNGDSLWGEYTVTDIYYNGMAVHCKTPLTFHSGWFVMAHQEDAVVIYDTRGPGVSYPPVPYYILSSGRVDFYSNDYRTDGYSIIFRRFDDGKLNYIKSSGYFHHAQFMEVFVDGYHSDDQFYMENGIVEITDDGIKFAPTLYWTINDWFVNVFLTKFVNQDEPDYGAKTMGEYVDRYNQAHGKGVTH